MGYPFAGIHTSLSSRAARCYSGLHFMDTEALDEALKETQGEAWAEGDPLFFKGLYDSDTSSGFLGGLYLRPPPI